MQGKTETTGTARDTLRIYWRASLKHKKNLFFAFFTCIGNVFTAVLVPLFASKVLAGVVQGDASVTAYLWGFAGSAAIGLTFNRIGFINNLRMQARVMHDLNHMVFGRLLHRSIGFHSNRISGKLVSDALDFISSYSQLALITLNNGLSFAVVILVGLTVVWINSWQLGAFMTFVVTATLVWTAINSQMRSRLRAKRLAANKALTAHLSDTIVNAQTVKTFAQEKLELQQNQKLNSKLEKIRIKDWTQGGHNGGNRMAALITMQFVLMILIVHLTRNDPAVLGAGIFAFTYTFMLITRLFEIDAMTRQLEEAFLNASPMSGMLKEIVEIQDKPNATTMNVERGKIEIKNVSFAYPDNTHNGAVFEHFNLSIAPGEKVGLVGPSGGGKSTLTRLFLRFEDIEKGEILFDNQNIADVTQESLRNNIAYVPQEPLLFHRSIRENIAYGRPNATEKDIVGAAMQANAHDFIQKLPQGYDTMVGERGVKLSGGQRQRVAIARAILKDAPILILDEATSALDSENEKQVQDALWHLMQGRTTIVIAHRLSTIQKMDRIIVLEDGSIVEKGSHKTLLSHKGTYAKLWKHQSGGFIEE